MWMLTSYNYEDKHEAMKVKRVSKKIRAFINLSDSYEFGKYTKSETGNGFQYSTEVKFISGEQQIVSEFLFIPVGPSLLLEKIK